jgi:hypothetical protein
MSTNTSVYRGEKFDTIQTNELVVEKTIMYKNQLMCEPQQMLPKEPAKPTNDTNYLLSSISKSCVDFIADNEHIPFDTTTYQMGTNITSDTSSQYPDLGRIKLAAGTAYRILMCLSNVVDLENVDVIIWNVTDDVPLTTVPSSPKFLVDQYNTNLKCTAIKPEKDLIIEGRLMNVVPVKGGVPCILQAFAEIVSL